jgi:hypothetical protein
MANYLNLQVPSSCHENWYEMAPEERGRFCLSCKKSVVDFTHMSDRELTQYFQANKGAAYGRFTESQLNRDILLLKKPLPWIKYFFLFSLPAFLLSLKSAAQLHGGATPVEAVPVMPKVSSSDSTMGETITLCGVVTDEAGVPLQFAYVGIKNTNYGTFCDNSGYFVLDGVAAHDFIQLTPSLKGEEVMACCFAPKKVKRKERKEHKQLSTEASSLLVYPNPVVLGNKLNVQCRSLEPGSYSAELYTLSGQLVQDLKVTYAKVDKEISLPVGLPNSGTYLLRLTHEKTGKQFSQQVVVQN